VVRILQPQQKGTHKTENTVCSGLVAGLVYFDYEEKQNPGINVIRSKTNANDAS
jgi:hypothetical protein